MPLAMIRSRFALLLGCLVGWLVNLSAPASRAEESHASRFVAMDNHDAWARLPREEPMLPVWARTLADALPRTTAAMLDLDYLQRAENPLDPVLRGKLRWVAADAIGCEYGRRYALSDLQRAGLADEDVQAFASREAHGPAEDQDALDFAWQLTVAAYKVTDEEVASLLDRYGPELVVAMVHTVAYANFQDRILLALATAVEDGGPLAPLAAHVDFDRTDVAAPARTDTLDAEAPVFPLQPNWRGRNTVDLLQAMALQKNRQPRIPLPDASRLANLPADVRERAERVVWSKVSMGYQPRLTKAWFDAMYTFQEEAQLDRVFSNTIFWVITRTNDCFY
jgi:alkylhydroperoxidase family enzyme